MAMTMFRDLPSDLVEEIFCHIPATYLKQLKSTSKRLNRLVNGDSRFARKHTDKATKQFLVLMLKDYRIGPTIFNLLHGSVEFKSELSLVHPRCRYSDQYKIARVFHCDGLLLCIYVHASNFVVWNPFTGETRWFFQPMKFEAYDREMVLGYYHENNDKRYKILMFSRVRKDHKIYEFSSNSWRTLIAIIPPGWIITVVDVSVSLKGNTYWFAADGKKAQSIISLLKFDFQTEKSVPVPLPYQCPRFESSGLSVVREEKLAVMLQRDVTSKTEIWVTNKIDETTQVVSWSKVLALDLSPDLQICDDVNFLLDEEKKVVMMCVRRWYGETKMKNMIYTVGKDGDEVTQVEIGTDYQSQTSILIYVPSLVQIEQGGCKRKRGDLSKM